MNYFLEFKQWVDQNPQEKTQVSPSIWSTALDNWSQGDRWKKVLQKTLIWAANIPTNSPARVVHRWIENGGLPILYQLSLGWDGLKQKINSWQSNWQAKLEAKDSKLSEGQKLVREIKEVIYQHTNAARVIIDLPNSNPKLMRGHYMIDSQQRTIAINGMIFYKSQDFTKINEQLDSLTLIFQSK
jgi:hypothetical protein